MITLTTVNAIVYLLAIVGTGTIANTLYVLAKRADYYSRNGTLPLTPEQLDVALIKCNAKLTEIEQQHRIQTLEAEAIQQTKVIEEQQESIQKLVRTLKGNS